MNEITEAKQKLKESQEKAAQQCLEELNLLLNKHNCAMVACVKIEGNEISPYVKIVPKT